MVKKTWWVALLLATMMLLLPISSVFAAESITGFTTWPNKTTSDVKKVWSITFNSALALESVNSNTIYVMNSKQVKVVTTVGLFTDCLTATITPTQAYVAGDYKLYITEGISSLAGNKLAEQIIVPFTVVVDTPISSTYILDVNSNSNSYVADLNVRTAPDVYRVDVNKVKMQYMGDDMYNVGIFGQKKGSTLLIEAYDHNGKLLQSYKFLLS